MKHEDIAKNVRHYLSNTYEAIFDVDVTKMEIISRLRFVYVEVIDIECRMYSSLHGILFPFYDFPGSLFYKMLYFLILISSAIRYRMHL